LLHRELIFVGDSSIAALDLLGCVSFTSKTSLITRLRMDAELWDPAAEIDEDHSPLNVLPAIVLLTTIYYLIYILIMPEIDVQKFLPLKTQWFHIMLSLAGGEQHGYGIMQDVLDRTDGKVRLWPATLYGSIKRLIEAELIEESDERPAPELDDARRRYYRLTALGRRVLDAECERLQELVRVIRVKQGMVTE
jgi:DNA-binding PadR family transcriptional regulator